MTETQPISAEIPVLSEKLLHILQHSLGVDEFGRGRQYRNHFVTGPGSDDWAYCQTLCSAGLMNDHGPQTLFGGNCFYVTDLGKKAVSTQSPLPPKKTRAQRRYEDFLREDSTMSFGEWLKVQKFRERPINY